ncbi:MAG: LysM peptidoglycan-binding domain-containing protein [Myxococcales bacterium]|nr:LysM peptidoglycan-binding domain-containing protein [Myxococcales bacterium]
MTRSLPTTLLATSGVLCFALACGGGDDPESPRPEAVTEPEVVAAEEADAGAEGDFAEHTVEQGQTLWDIARLYGVSVRDILDANQLTRRDARRINPGRVLRIPGVTGPLDASGSEEDAGVEMLAEGAGDAQDGGVAAGAAGADGGTDDQLVAGAYHTLSEGETLWDLANAYDKTVDELLEANTFNDDDVRSLRPGRRILIPGVEESAIRSAVRPEGRGIWHTVGEGESIWDIARRYRMGASEIMGANSLSREDVSDLRTGRRVFIPGRGPARGSSRVSSERPVTPAQRRAMGRARLLGLGTDRAGHKLLGGIVEDRWVRAAGGNAERFAGTLRWPVTNGRFVRGYGSGEQGYHLAVDIAGDIGWNVRASAPGLVGYSGDGIRGYGNIVLVIHQGGWVTLYAHNSVNFVVAGERVRAGGVLAEVGSTGISRGPHVHFEFMYNGQNCDPARLFRPGLRYSGSRSRPGNLEWLLPSNRPEPISCARRRRHPRGRWTLDSDVSP